jgi:hypothetical protein
MMSAAKRDDSLFKDDSFGVTGKHRCALKAI